MTKIPDVLSADGIALKPGMKIWVKNSTIGDPPTEHVVGEIVNEFKILYKSKCNNGFLGCKADVAWVSAKKALEYALSQNDEDEIELKIKELFDLMDAIPGEVRTVLECNHCKRLIGRRYIPYGLGIGLILNPCLCHCVNSNNKETEVARLEP